MAERVTTAHGAGSAAHEARLRTMVTNFDKLLADADEVSVSVRVTSEIRQNQAACLAGADALAALRETRETPELDQLRDENRRLHQQLTAYPLPPKEPTTQEAGSATLDTVRRCRRCGSADLMFDGRGYKCVQCVALNPESARPVPVPAAPERAALIHRLRSQANHDGQTFPSGGEPPTTLMRALLLEAADALEVAVPAAPPDLVDGRARNRRSRRNLVTRHSRRSRAPCRP